MHTIAVVQGLSEEVWSSYSGPSKRRSTLPDLVNPHDSPRGWTLILFPVYREGKVITQVN